MAKCLMSNTGAKRAARPRIFVLGYGNPGRRDDGLGPELARRIEELALDGVETDADYQLNIEDAATLASHDIIVFADASKNAPESFIFERLEPAAEVAFTSHSVSPGSVLAICEEHFQARPKAWVLGIRGYEFEFKEGLSPQARDNLEQALAFVLHNIRTWRESNMESSNTIKKTILTIDDDPDIRAALRMVLEAEGFAVGEASSGEEGLKIAARINPDAVVIDLMMETVDAGAVAAKKLKESGYPGPIYLLSSAGDTVRYNIDARDLGLAGIFQKPIDPKMLVTTLKTKLKGNESK